MAHDGAGSALDRHPSNMHTMVLGDCTQYFQWLSMGMYYSHARSGQPGPITRILCCSDEARESIPQSWLDLGPTHLAKSMARNPHNDDVYGAYNKPYAVIDFLENSPPKEEWLIIIDADMIMRLPFLCKGENFENGEDASLEMNCERGRPISAFYGYLIGTTNDLALRHIPEVAVRNDTDGGQPLHRRSDQVGGFVVVHRDDMLQYMHDWLKITEDVRFDPEAWRLAGDVYATEAGKKPWISEMYGYSFAAAKHGMWHQIDRLSMLYPSYVPATPPRVMHYGLDFSIKTNTTPFSFDKHHYINFDAFSCSVVHDEHEKAGLLPMPPTVEELVGPQAGPKRLKDLLSIETILTLNEAFCQHHREHCDANASAEAAALLAQCDEVFAASDALRQELWRVGSVEPPEETALCQVHRDTQTCRKWVDGGECLSNPSAMAVSCLQSCGMCRPVLPRKQVFALHSESRDQSDERIREPLSAEPAESIQREADPTESMGIHHANLVPDVKEHPTDDWYRSHPEAGHHVEFSGNDDAQLRGNTPQLQARPQKDSKSVSLDQSHPARHSDTHAPHRSSTINHRQRSTTLQSQVGQVLQHGAVINSDVLVANAKGHLPVMYGVVSLSVWLLVVATVLALGSATRRHRMRRGPGRRSQYPDIGEFF